MIRRLKRWVSRWGQQTSSNISSTTLHEEAVQEEAEPVLPYPPVEKPDEDWEDTSMLYKINLKASSIDQASANDVAGLMDYIDNLRDILHGIDLCNSKARLKNLQLIRLRIAVLVFKDNDIRASIAQHFGETTVRDHAEMREGFVRLHSGVETLIKQIEKELYNDCDVPGIIETFWKEWKEDNPLLEQKAASIGHILQEWAHQSPHYTKLLHRNEGSYFHHFARTIH